MEEDNEDLKIDFVDWGLGAAEKADVARFITLRNTMWMAMNYRACVSLRTCHEVVAYVLTPLWNGVKNVVNLPCQQPCCCFSAKLSLKRGMLCLIAAF